MAKQLNLRRRYARKTARAQRKRSATRRRTMKRRLSRKQRGGTCYGTGVGANTGDPNFSIYNTRELELFPYKPTN